MELRPNHLSIRRLERADLALFGPKSIESAREWIAAQDIGAAYIAVAELDGAFVAKGGVHFVQRAPDAYIWTLGVDEEHRSRGIGTALIQHLERVARDREFDCARLLVGKDNPRAQRLYEQLGYRVDGEDVDEYSYPEDDGRIVVVRDPCWSMFRSLADG